MHDIIKKNKKVFSLVYLLIFLPVCFFCLPINKISAAGLEVIYPAIGTTTLATDAKLPAYVKYLFDAGMFLGFFSVLVSLIIAGIMYLLSPAKPDLLGEAKDRIGGAISGLLILTLTYLIITTINPQLSFFKFDELPTTACNSNNQCVADGTGASCLKDADCSPKKAPGVYFYKKTGCSDDPKNTAKANITSIPDLGDNLRNKINSVGIVQDADTQTAYITVLYDNINFWGKCQEITTTKENTNETCQNVSPFAASASVYKYDFDANDDGVYFFRKSCLKHYCASNDDCTNGETCNTSTGICVDNMGNSDSVGDLIAQCKKDSGGWYKVTNDEIKNAGVYIHALDDQNNPLQFNDVPENEKPCAGYGQSGNCISKISPSLGGENISSMIIHNDYIVLFTYASPGQSCNITPWTFCQEFPTSKDANKFGPQQIKWQNIRNNSNVVPNCMIIIPIQK
ncbi:MAG: hypothetical protein NTY81_01265 [Candidatus Staskawiczbacteria bacterium]|nr:hypothetical protein [Candidatus Staskawiczbacteria bacterium]